MSSYEEDQAALRGQQDGTEDIHVEVPSAIPEVNPEIFRDVEPLLFRGFLHVHAEINDVSFIFKSLNHHEFELLKLISPHEGSRRAIQKFYAHFLAYGVLMVDGSNVLLDRESTIPELVELFQSLGEAATNRVVHRMSEVNRRANQAVALTEAYCMEPASRLRWAQLKGLDATSTAVTGLQGTQTLGMNWAQLTWQALNRYEDLREQSEREWENAKFIASSMAGKGMNRVHSQDRRRREKEREERVERRDKVIRFAILGESMDKQSSIAPVKFARTVAELQSQLEKDLKGEKDWHDRVVEAYEKRAQESLESRHQHIRQLQKSFDEEFGPNRLIGGTELTGLSPEEVNFQINRRRQLAAQRLSAQQVHPELTDPKAAQFVEKWSSASKPSQVPLVPTSPREPGVPFGRK